MNATQSGETATTRRSLLKAAAGPVLLGCSRKAEPKNPIRLVVGGLHMHRQSAEEFRRQIAALQKLNVQRVMPAHCSGDLPKRPCR